MDRPHGRPWRDPGQRVDREKDHCAAKQQIRRTRRAGGCTADRTASIELHFMNRSVAACLSLLFAPALLAQDAKRPSPDDQYKLGADSQPQPGVPQGDIFEAEWTASTIYPGTVRKYWIYVPKQYDAKKSACLMVFQDGGGYVKRDGAWRVPVVFDNLIHKKEMPVTVGLFVNPGDVPLQPGEAPRKRADGRPAGA